MKVNSKVFKRRTGKSKDTWVVRIEYFDPQKGKKCYMERHAVKRTEALDLRNKLIDDIKKSYGQIQTGEKMTFTDLALICEEQFYKPAQIVQGRKVSGVRGVSTARTHLTTLKRYFGERYLSEITTESLLEYKLWRLGSVVENRSSNVKIATVNRELSTLRKMMRHALAKGWVVRDIFFNAKVIDSAAEVERTRILTSDEETRLLQACEGQYAVSYLRQGKITNATVNINNQHLRAIIVLAIDSGLRRGEIFKLRWQDIDFEADMIRVIGTHTKTERERLAPLSNRAKVELFRIRESSKGERPFPYSDIKRSFATAKRLANIEELHFHDLRRTAITRWIQQGSPLALAGKLAGHTQLQTTMKHYTATDAEMVRDVSEKINHFHSTNENGLMSKMVN